MDFIDKLRELSTRIPKQLDYIQTEEATKNALVLPFLNALGYNVFDPTEVTPELTADVGLKKGEKVDYAILREGKPIVLFECKHHTVDLGKAQASQLYRYFGVTEARFGVLTNGIVYWFYTDLEAPNKMDTRPFFEFNMLEIKDTAVDELKKFSKSAFDLDNILTTASELKYTREIRRIISEQMLEPSDELVRFIAAQVYTGKLTLPVRQHFAQLTKQAFKQVVNEQINERLKTALASDTATINPVGTESAAVVTPVEAIGAQVPAGEIVTTTSEEIEAFHIVRALLREVVDPKRVVMRDVKSYCSVLLDDKNRKPICRFHFNREQKYLGLFSGETASVKDGQKEERIPIKDIDEIYSYAKRLKETVAWYHSGAS